MLRSRDRRPRSRPTLSFSRSPIGGVRLRISRTDAACNHNRLVKPSVLLMSITRWCSHVCHWSDRRQNASSPAFPRANVTPRSRSSDTASKLLLSCRSDQRDVSRGCHSAGASPGQSNQHRARALDRSRAPPSRCAPLSIHVEAKRLIPPSLDRLPRLVTQSARAYPTIHACGYRRHAVQRAYLPAKPYFR